MTVDRQRRFTSEFVRSQHRVFGYIVTLVPHRSDAEEVFQQVCLILWEKWDHYEPDRDFVRWACGVAWNVVQNHRRQRAGAEQLYDEELLAALAATHLAHEPWLDTRRQALPGCLDKLLPEQRRLVEHCYLGGESIAGMAVQLGISAAALTMRLQRIRKLLFDCLTQAVAGDARA